MCENTGHDWWHVYRVWKIAEHIGMLECADMFVVQLAALLHDLDDWKFHDHFLAEGPTSALLWMQEMKLSLEVREHVIEVITDMPFKGTDVSAGMRTLEGQIVQDADRIDAMGAIGIARAFAYGGYAGKPIYDPDTSPERHSSFQEYRENNKCSINHFYEKLLLLRDRMNTESGKRLAEERHDFMSSFLDHFMDEWKLEDILE